MDQKAGKADHMKTLIRNKNNAKEIINEKGESYTVERMKEVIKNNARLPAEKIAEAVLKDINVFTGSGQKTDDQTLLIIKAV